jgi:hypothetical protein
MQQHLLLKISLLQLKFQKSKIMKKFSRKEKRKKESCFSFIKWLFIFILSIPSLQLSAQTPLLNLNMKNVSLHEILKEIKKQSGKNIVYNNNLIDKFSNESIDMKNAGLDDVLNKVLEGKNLSYRIVDDVIVIESLPEKPKTEKAPGLSQTVRGNVFDIESNTPLIGATVFVLNSNPIIGITTDLDGNFKLEKVPVGRNSFQVSYMGYEPSIVSEILVTTGKEVIINIGLKQSINQMKEVSVKPNFQKDKPINNMSSVSARSFSVEETRRYAGGADDPARMASAFAGVTVGNMQDNGIIIRGNSPKGLGWRLEGIEVPNPNHFAGLNVAGGGGVTIFSSQMLANSDFFTGAFPAEYGNAVAGIFDIKLRSGNSNKREHTFQIGTMGIDFASEGPFKKESGATYLFNYRYSTLGLLFKLKIIPMNEMMSYQDLSFKIKVPTKSLGTFSLWAIGGLDKDRTTNLKDSSEWKTYWDRIESNIKLSMWATGLSNKYQINQKTNLNTTLAATGYSCNYSESNLDANLQSFKMYDLNESESSLILSSYINHKFNTQHSIKTGFNAHLLYYNIDNRGATSRFVPSTYQQLTKENNNSSFYEYYIHYKFDITANLSLNGGLNASYFAVNKELSIDPRAGLKWQFAPHHALSFGYGKHSQRESLKFYFIRQNVNGQTVFPNKNLKLTQSEHYVLGYDWQINKNLRLKVEPYYQYLYNVPGKPRSSYSMINFKQDLAFSDSLINSNFGRNVGIDFTFERFLANNFYYLITCSFFKSTYKGDDGVWRDSRYDKGIAVNLLFGKEFFFSKNRVLGLNGRFNYVGGEKYSPIDEARSIQMNDACFDESKAFSEQFPSISYLNFTITFRTNKPKYSGIWAIQILNALGAPQYQFVYNYRTMKVERQALTVIVPVISYKIEF